ncbi:ATP-binding protein [Allosalinactinospora lopnorensis]|uniref:ATP-binding protein n=1 Tax=Allosalinactinospora lopnorensis TaxID=1352348 RepID=UPI0009E4EDC8|nr:ATP-binding protein [Allosalinactinospora lopnorensis]
MNARFASCSASDPHTRAGIDRVLSAIEPADAPSGWWGLTSMPLPIGHRVLDRRIAAQGLGFHASSVRTARDFARTALSSWGLADLSGLLGEVRLVVSELVTNACRHAVPETAGAISEWSIQLGLLREGTQLTCMAFDPSHRVPELGEQSDLEEGGRGLHLIESFSSAWGWHLLEGQGKVVWAVLTVVDRS